jgi:bifunctional DNA-binding transcriptional regulator/antitoxin component of YhaV-PrlF toxin-antitoxin module
MVTAQARIRAKSQLTLPDPIVRAAGVAEGDRYIVEVSPEEPDTIRFHRIRSTYAGALADLFADGVEYLEHERNSWTARRE